MTTDLYEIRVRGKLSASLQSAFHGMTGRVEPIETILSGTLDDQSALFGLLLQVQALGLELIEVQARRRPSRRRPAPAPTRETSLRARLTRSVRATPAPGPPRRPRAGD